MRDGNKRAARSRSLVLPTTARRQTIRKSPASTVLMPSPNAVCPDRISHPVPILTMAPPGDWESMASIAPPNSIERLLPPTVSSPEPNAMLPAP